jgi:hypothetical protein
MIRGLLTVCILIITACSNQGLQDDRWSAYNSRSQGAHQTGNIEYNGMGGSGRQQDSSPENGLGGSGIRLDKAQANGLGGSGRQAPDPLQNGLGGSGKAAILGPISAFGSIWVNDRHIQLPDTTQYLIAGHKAEHKDLRLGQVVAVLADSLGDDDYEALEVHLLYNVVGRIVSLIAQSPTAAELMILGQNVVLDSETRLENHQGKQLSLDQLNTGDRIAVSGIRMPNKKIKATLIITQPVQTTLLAGPIRVVDGKYWLAQQRLVFSGQAPELNQPLHMEGNLAGDSFIVDEWQVLPHHRIFELVDEIWLEGFPLSDAELFIEGFEVSLPEFTDDLFDADDSIRIGIDRDEQEFWMDHDLPNDIHEEFFEADDSEYYESEFDESEYYDPEFDDVEYYLEDDF